jgi:hypothetical protein
MKKAFETPYLVAELISETPCREGVLTSKVRAANPKHPESGRKRLREIARRFRLMTGQVPYHYEDNRFFPTGPFKKFCRAEMKRYEMN